MAPYIVLHPSEISIFSVLSFFIFCCISHQILHLPPLQIPFSSEVNVFLSSKDSWGIEKILLLFFSQLWFTSRPTFFPSFMPPLEIWILLLWKYFPRKKNAHKTTCNNQQCLCNCFPKLRLQIWTNMLINWSNRHMWILTNWLWAAQWRDDF